MSKRKYVPAAKPILSVPATKEIFLEAEPAAEPKLQVTHTMKEGENIITIAQRYLPEGMTRSEYATRLVKSNSSFAVGRIIHLG